mgnify:FL=1
MKQTNTRAMVETAFVSTIVVMLTIVGSTVPFLSLLATLVAPSGIALIGIRWGSRYSCATSVVAFVLVSLLVGPLMAMATILAYSLPSIFLGEAFRANWSFGKLIVIPAIALTLTSLMGIFISAGLTSFDLSQINHIIDVDLKNAIIESVKQQPMTQEQMDAYINHLDFTIQQAKRMLLAYWFAANAVVVYMLAKLVSYIGGRTNSVMRTLPTMDTWRLPIWGAGVLAVGIILAYGEQYLGYTNTIISDVGLNLALFGGMVCGLNGITCLLSIMKSYNLASFFRFIIIALLYVMSPMALVIYGIFDMFLDMRARFQKRSL